MYLFLSYLWERRLTELESLGLVVQFLVEYDSQLTVSTLTCVNSLESVELMIES